MKKHIVTILFLFISCQSTMFAEQHLANDSKAVSSDYVEDYISVSVENSYLSTFRGDTSFYIDVVLEILNKNKIVTCWGRPIVLEDSFGNDLGRYTPGSAGNLRPGSKRLVILKYSILPLDNTEYLILKVPEKVFGNSKSFELKIWFNSQKVG